MSILEKCFVSHARHITRFNYVLLGDTSLHETDHNHYRAVHITKGLTWNKHIRQITVTANRTQSLLMPSTY